MTTTTTAPPAAAHADARFVFPRPDGSIIVETMVREDDHPDIAEALDTGVWVERPIGAGLTLLVRAGRPIQS